jgi:galactonate dehydratase
MYSCFTRRDLLRFWPAAAVAGRLQALGGPPLGKVKITKFVVHKATLRWRDLLHVEIHTDAGLVGIGEGSLHTRVAVVEEAVKWLEPHFVGRDPAGVEDHWDRMYYRLTRWRNGPALMTALSAVDIALWDLEGKRLGVPVWRLLGGPLNAKMRVYYTHWDSIVKEKTPSGYAEVAAATKAQGWTALKLGSGPKTTEEARVAANVKKLEAIRKAVGDEFDIGMELGESFTVRTALRFAQAVAPYRPMFIEEPTLREIPEAMTELAAKSPVPIATGEGLVSRYEFRRLLDMKGAQIIQPDVLHCGGITELRRIAEFSEPFGVEVAPHQCCGPIGHVASLTAMAGVRNFVINEWEAEDDPLFQEVTDGTYQTQKDGLVSLPQGPGLGLNFNAAEFSKRFPFRSGPRAMFPRS